MWSIASSDSKTIIPAEGCNLPPWSLTAGQITGVCIWDSSLQGSGDARRYVPHFLSTCEFSSGGRGADARFDLIEGYIIRFQFDLSLKRRRAEFLSFFFFVSSWVKRGVLMRPDIQTLLNLDWLWISSTRFPVQVNWNQKLWGHLEVNQSDDDDDDDGIFAFYNTFQYLDYPVSGFVVISLITRWLLVWILFL